MKSLKKSVILFIVLAIVTLSLGVVTTVNAVKAGNDYKEGMKSYNAFADAEGTVIGDYAAKLAAKAFADTETAQICKSKLYKNFALSLLLYLACGVSVGIAYVKQTGITKKTE